MKLALLGATGNVGSRTLKAVVDAGHEVVAYARRPEAVAALPGVTIVGGELDDVTALSAAIAGADALIVSVTGPIKDKTFARRTTRTIIEAAGTAGVRRVVYVSAFGAGDTAAKASLFARLVYRTVLRGFFDDKAAAEQLLTRSGLDWTIVFPVNLKDAPEKPAWTVAPIDQVTRVPGLPTLPFGNLARSLVNLAGDPAVIDQRILVST